MAPQFLRNLLPKKEAGIDKQSFMTGMRQLTLMQVLLFISGLIAWTCDAMDFFSVSLSVTMLGETFNKKTPDITTSITLTLLFRSLGALVFGLLSDRFGRKWPLIFNLLLCCVFELGTGFVNTYSQFLALRAIFGIAMGGIWGLASATALENLPVQLRGVASGILQEGYALGYLIAAVVNLTLVPEQKNGWRALFWTAAGLSFFAAVVRAFLPESEVFLRAKRMERERIAAGLEGPRKTKTFMRETWRMLKIHWKLWIYAVLLMSGFNFLSHGSQDLFPTYMQITKGKSAHEATVATIIGNCGAIVGGAIAGAVSQFIGRRLTIIICILFIGAFIPLWILPSSFGGLSAGAFFIQVGVQGAWGVIPIFLAELSPPAFRALFPGLSYQLGNMVSSASAQIEATGGAHQKVLLNGVPTPDYATVQGIFIGVVAAFTLIMTIIGPENHGSQFEKHKTAFEEGGGVDDAYMEDDLEGDVRDSNESVDDEKGENARKDHV